ncbi:MAG: DUF5050 domain-containing protein [Verrucomicrobiota bacterium]|nr:DUF5050 domain-containing protein [Verrucomicrobiota bacterium]
MALQGNGLAQTGSLQVTINPSGAISAGAPWQVDGGAWQNSGATVSGLTVGSHNLSFKAISGWNTPNSQNVTINSSSTTLATGTYTQQTGSLQVTISPSGAVSAGAQWQVDGGAWQNSGVTVSGLTVGTHTVHFNSINGWSSPGDQDVTINNAVTATTTGTYSTQIGSLQVTLAPAGAVSVGAQWQVDGGAFQNSGATVSGLSVGSHLVAFKPVSGWTTPSSQNVTVNADQTTTATGTYIPISSGQPQLSGVSMSKDGMFHFTLNGPVGTNYAIEVSSNLVNWMILSTNTIPASGATNIINAVQPNWPMRFYRAVPISAVGSAAPVLIASNLNNPNNLVLDSGYIYFADSTSSDGILKRVLSTGGTVATLATGLSTSDGHTPTAVVAGSTLYGGVGGYSAYDVFSLPASGGSDTILTSTTGGIFLGVSGSTIYYSSGFSYVNGIPTSGGSSTQLASGNWVRSFAMDDSAIYFCEYSSKDVRKFTLSSHAIATLVTGNSSEVGVFIDTNNVYLNDNGNIKVVPKAGGAETTLVSSGVANGLASDGTNVYYLENSVIKYIPVTGGSSLDLTAIPTNSLTSFVIGSANVYWSDTSGGAGAGKIWRMAKP